jgi:hypothetical protein
MLMLAQPSPAPKLLGTECAGHVEQNEQLRREN